MRDEEDAPGRRDIAPDDLSDQTQPVRDDSASGTDGTADAPPPPSLSDDLTALVEDGKTYAEAELAYQKSRAAFAGDRAKSIAVYGIFALGFLHLALVVLVVGSVFALAQVINPWLATAIVTLVLVFAIVILGLMIRAKVREIGSAFGDDSGVEGDEGS